MQELLKEMHAWMDAYMKSFHTDDEEVMQGIRIKEIHTGYVTTHAIALAKHLHLSAHDVALAEIMGLFHDVGRFRQYSLYKTFNDAESEDHADLGLKVLSELDFMKKLAPEDEELVRFAISRHNKKEIGPVADRRHLVFAQIIRDADKLDIYRVLSPFLTPDGAEKAPKFIASDASQLVSPDFIEDFKAGRQADYRKLRTHGDRKLVRLLWVYDIYFNWTLREIVKRGYIERIIRYLPDQPGMEEGVARLRTYVEKRCKEEDSAGI
ncbi:HD domain-containing protein [Mitsuokella sp. AF21-1AC]|uniref:HD domain-containing protein n=1 Tax=Mitsuokella sp. AF21-1AC TaxID=2292235 RepID=UPI000E4748BC|nr:HD domain-containing protein [Mitsuokella sp. AF21-1AC]RGS72352.1 HD domain-containing protein [Mitsuokella sp. AF21-1AC]